MSRNSNRRQDKHACVGDGLMCNECGQPRTAPIHVAAPAVNPPKVHSIAPDMSARIADVEMAARLRSTPKHDLVETVGEKRNRFLPVGTLADFVQGFAEEAPDGANVCEYFGVEGDPGAYSAFYSGGLLYGRWLYFHNTSPPALRELGRREGRWLTAIRNKQPIPFARTSMHVM